MDNQFPSTTKPYERCPKCFHKLPLHRADCQIGDLVSRRSFLKKLGISSGLAAAGGIGYLVGQAQATPSMVSPVAPGSTKIPASYIVYRDGPTILARNGDTGQNDYSGTDAATVIQNAIDALPTTGGTIFIRAGSYDITSTIILKDCVELEGENVGYVVPAGGTVLRVQANVNVISLVGTIRQHKLMPSIKSIYFDGDGRKWQSDAIHFEKVSVPLVRDVFIINFNGSAIYLDSVFNGAFSNVKIDNCGAGNPAFVLTGSEGCSSIMVEQVDNSLFQNSGLFISSTCAEIAISDYFGDGLLTNTLPALDIQGNRVNLTNVHCRGVGVDSYMVKLSGDRIQFNNLYVEGRGKLLLTEGGAGNVLLGSAHFEGESYANNAQLAIDCQAGTMSIGLVQFEYVAARANLTNGIIVPFDSSQSAGIETESYGLIETANVNGSLDQPNRSAFMPVFVPRIITVETIKIRVATQAGNIDLGIYDADGKRVVSTGSIAVPAAGFAFVRIARTALFPGLHYFALASDNTTAAFYKTKAITLGSKKAFYADMVFPLPATLPSIAESGDWRFWMEAV